jgi:hypothetical protein
MSRFGNNTYNPTGNSGTDSTDYKDRDSMLLGKYAVISFNLADVGAYDGQYGTSMILNMDDVDVHEGVVGERTDDGKEKVFGWDHWFQRDEDTMELIPFDDGDTISKDALPKVESQSAGGSTYRYELGDAVLEGRDDPVTLGDRELWLSNGKKARTLAKVLSEHGRDAVDDDRRREDSGWLRSGDSFAFRDELEGRRMEMWFESVTIPEEELDDEYDDSITFTDSVLYDAKTGEGIVMKNNADADTNGSGDSGNVTEASGESEPEAGTVSDSDTTDFPAEVDSIINVLAESDNANRSRVETMMDGDKHDISIGAVMDEIEARQ